VQHVFLVFERLDVSADNVGARVESENSSNERLGLAWNGAGKSE
jgi:hypothetical protein